MQAKKRPAACVSTSATVSKQTVVTSSDGISKPKKSAPSTGPTSSSNSGQAAGSSASHQTPSSGLAHSIQENPNVSSVYKSLFNTSEEAKRQPKSHWVTFNPLYFR
ncbi:Protein RTF2 protein [Fasciola gigantica]|uniref:Protein RTF2 protein n=1 Tax=Fasciola gigantica TaxID=46835 RepID=A0A504Z4R6_FASGI|nr:Protein RTF2 protein [Fasciola gigantica]